MNCAKRTVTCKIVAVNGDEYVAQNWCANPQIICPREPGEGYEKCQTICQQIGHAEELAVYLAGDMCEGATAYISGHEYACLGCCAIMKEAGIEKIVIV